MSVDGSLELSQESLSPTVPAPAGGSGTDASNSSGGLRRGVGNGIKSCGISYPEVGKHLVNEIVAQLKLMWQQLRASLQNSDFGV